MTTVEVRPRPPIRVRQLPSADPPYDDELEPRRWETANQLTLEWPTPDRTWQPPQSPAAEHLARKVAAARVTAGTAGDAKLAVRLFVQMYVEVLNGYRPAGHLAKLTVPKEATNVVSEAVSSTTRVAALRTGAAATTPRRQRRPADRLPVEPRPAERLPAERLPTEQPSADRLPTEPRPAARLPADRRLVPQGGAPATSAGRGRPASSAGGIPSEAATKAERDGSVQRGGCTLPANTAPVPQSPGRRSVRDLEAPGRGASQPPQAPGRGSARGTQATSRPPTRAVTGATAALATAATRAPAIGAPAIGAPATAAAGARATIAATTTVTGATTTATAGNRAQPAHQVADRAAAMRQFPRRRGAVDVLKFHFCEPRPGAVESTILLATGDRTRALALRMELQGRRWMAAAIRLL